MYELLVSISLICVSIALYATNVQLKRLARLIESQVSADIQPAQVSDKREEEYVDPFDAEQVKKKQAFNERIARIKDELATEHAKRMNKTTDSAQIMHPDVYNLPHDSIITTDAPDVEYAD